MSNTMLDRILAPDGLRVVFQPLLDFSEDGWKLHGFEALVRGPAETHMRAAEVLFEYVRRKGAECEVDLHCAESIFMASGPLGRSSNLSLNVHASTLEQDGSYPLHLEQLARDQGWPPSHVTVEIVEHAPAWSGCRFNRALARLREIGFSIALDDVGLGSSNYRMILECQPDYFKIDQFLVAGAHADKRRRSVLRSVAELASSFGAVTVGEGVENIDDLRTLICSGVHTIQGYLLARPSPASALGNSEFLNAIVSRLPSRFDAMDDCPVDDWLRHSSEEAACATVC
jgi:EAL domain-containing protein (putative c-di-GMP-specific phosphodiesterase class I)